MGKEEGGREVSKKRKERERREGGRELGLRRKKKRGREPRAARRAGHEKAKRCTLSLLLAAAPRECSLGITAPTEAPCATLGATKLDRWHDPVG